MCSLERRDFAHASPALCLLSPSPDPEALFMMLRKVPKKGEEEAVTRPGWVVPAVASGGGEYSQGRRG